MANTGLEPLIGKELYWEMYDLGVTPKYNPIDQKYNPYITKKDGGSLSSEAENVLINAPHLLYKVVAYLQDPSEKTLEAMKGQVASSLGIRGWARPDYAPKDPRVGL
jgi:hypothetical protein